MKVEGLFNVLVEANGIRLVYDLGRQEIMCYGEEEDMAGRMFWKHVWTLRDPHHIQAFRKLYG